MAEGPNFASIDDTFVLIEFDGGTRMVHKDLICQQSPLFERAFNGSFREGTQQRVKIDAPFDLAADLLTWLYCARLPPHPESALSPTISETNWTVSATVRLYCLADRYDIPKLQRSCLFALYGQIALKHLFCSIDALEIYTNLPESDLLYRILVYSTAFRFTQSMFKSAAAQKAQDEMPAAFWLAVARQMPIWREKGHPKWIPGAVEFEEDETLGRPVEPQPEPSLGVGSGSSDVASEAESIVITRTDEVYPIGRRNAKGKPR